MFEKPRPWWHGAYILRVGLGLVFLLAGALKLADLPGFLQDVLRYGVLAGPAAGWLAVLLPVLEVLVGLFLILGWLQAGSLSSVIGLTLLFLFVHGYAIQRGLDIECGCFGAISPPVYAMVGANLALLVGSLWLLVDHLRLSTADKPKYTLSRDLMRKRRR